MLEKENKINVIRNDQTRVPVSYALAGFIIGLVLWFVAVNIELLVRSYPPLEASMIVKLYLGKGALVWIFSAVPFVLSGAGYLVGSFHVQRNILMVNRLKSQDENMQRVTEFAQNIGQGKLDFEINGGAEDSIAESLQNMKDNLIESAQKDEESQWIMEGQAKISDILRISNDMDELANSTIANVVELMNAVQGSFYVYNDDDSSDEHLEMVSCYAYNRKKHIRKRFNISQGLVGQCAFEKDTIHRTEIPEDYVTITSGILGDQKPGSLLLVPLISDEELYGVIEIAGFNRFTELQVRFLEQLSEVIARTLFNFKANDKNLKLLEEVNNSQKRTNVLLENASEVIIVYDENRNIKYISPSVTHILGYFPEDMIGRSDMNLIHERQSDFSSSFKQLIEVPNEQVVVMYSYEKQDGSKIWLEALGINLLDDPSIEGIVFNSRDITERLKAEEEQRIRGKMQALSENSPDLIMRFELDGQVSYVNPEISNLTQYNPSDIHGRKYTEVGFDEKVVEVWTKILDQVREKNATLLLEESIPTSKGELIFEVNAIPEFDDQSAIESVLVVSHDITDAKLAERAIKESNKKISDSINYGLGIQKAILPNMDVVKETFEDSFQLYLPRDIVSGDFPWFHQKGDDIYYAVCDCTGHGVPGCLLSLIGYSALEKTISRTDVNDPATLLINLHWEMVRTLRQEQNDSSDGMDVGVIKVNKKSNTVMFAGAHRPMYFIRNGELTEIKGSKFPIGGVQYKGRQNFENWEMQLEKDDIILYFSDGYPDQIGGPNGKKFRNKPIRDMIVMNKDQPMSKVFEVFKTTFFDYMNETNKKQVDDVLMVGIRF